MKHIFVETEENRKRYIKQEHRFIGVAIATIYGFYVLSTNIGYILRKLDTRDSVADMKTSISSNSNINEEEKEYLNGIDVFLNDYEKYIDIPFACEKLENFDILYKDCEDKGSVITKGIWSKSKGKITYYITDDESEELRKKTINHELLHLISSHDGYYPGILNEGITSVICYEYDLSTDYCYDKYRLITYMLCEIVSSETVVESYLKGDFSIIEKKLYEIIPDNKIIENFKENLNTYYEYNNLTNECLGKELDEYKDAIYKGYSDARDESLNKIANILCGYYTKKEDKLVGDSKTVEEMFKSGDTNNDYDLKMSIYNTELKKDNYSRFYNFNKKIAIYSITNTFEEKTAYFNKRNEKEVSFYEDGEWAFVIDKDTNSLVSKIDEYNKEEKILEKSK